jgi:hypothetical protein
MSYPFLPVNPCCTDVVLNSPCGCSSTLPNSGCGQDLCGTNVIVSSNVLYDGPVLDCIIVEPCDTLNVILQKIDEIICNLLIQINTLNIQISNITTQIINIQGDIININNTLAECCVTTTTTTTSCPCTTYGYVGPRINPGTITYVECNTLEPITDTASSTVQFACVDNNYPIIEIGSINVIDTQDCCSNITTTTTTTIPINPFCYEVTTVGKCTIYWTDANGNTQSQIVTDDTINICADEDSIASNCETIGITGGTVVCTNDAICQPPTTTTTTTPPATTTTTTTLPCVSYVLQSTGAGEASNQWEAFACNSNISVSGIIPFPGTMETGCITEGSLLLGANLEIVSDAPCEEVSCEAFEIQGLFPVGSWDAIDCLGNPVGDIAPSGSTVPTGCIIPQTLVLDNAYIKDYLGPCGSTTTTTTSIPPTTTTTTTPDPSFFKYFFSNPAISAALACNEVTFPTSLYSDDTTLNLGSFLYTDMTLTTPFPGAARWYKESGSGKVFAILNSGEIAGESSCTTTTTTTAAGIGYAQSFGADFFDSATACLETIGTYTIYTNTPTVSFSSTFYNEIGLTTLFNGGGLWYKEMLGIGAWQIGASGNPLGSALC